MATLIAACRPRLTAVSTHQTPARVDVWTYHVSVEPTGTTLAVEGELTDSTNSVSVDIGAEEFVIGLEAATLDVASIGLPLVFRPLQREGRGWQNSHCQPSCRIRYRFRLMDAARALQDGGKLMQAGSTVVGSASTWLVHPAPRLSARYRFQVDASRAPKELQFASGVSTRSPDVYEAPTTEMEDGPYSAFGPFHRRDFSLAGSTLDIAISPEARLLSDDAIEAWVRQSTATITDYLGYFPVRRTLILVVNSSFDDVRGRTSGGGGSAILISVGTHASTAKLFSSNVLAHECVHLSLPYFQHSDQWFAEGLATYVEAVARLRKGDLAEDAFWEHLMRQFPQGLPLEHELGLDGSTRVGRMYWGGALFFFLADVELQKQSDLCRRSLRDALLAIHERGGNIAEHWTIEEAIDVADSAAGAPVFRGLYQRLGREKASTDLDALWTRLGVEMTDAGVRYNDQAPLAVVRRCMSSRDNPK